MKAAALWIAGGVYEWANQYVDRCPLSWPYYVLAIAAAKVLDHYDPVDKGTEKSQTS